MVAVPHLALENLSKTFRDGRGNRIEAVRNFSLRINHGEFVTLIGPSGCGKTTTLRMIAGVEEPDSGRILLDGAVVTAMSPQQRTMPMVFQSYALFPHMTVFDNISYGLRLRSMTRDVIAHDVALACQMVGLVGVEHRYPGELSGGQQQRVALARALVLKPQIILFDEPLSNLDPRLRTQTRTAIRRVQQLLGITIVYVTHDQSEALSLSDRVVIMQNGDIVQEGPPRQVYRDPVSPFVADFIGQANFLDGTITALTGTAVQVTIQDVDLTLPLDRCPPNVEIHSDVLVAVHPEALTISRDPGGGRIAGVIESTSFRGPLVEYVIACGSGWVTVVTPDREDQTAGLTEGVKVYLSLDHQAVRLFGTEP